MNRFAEIWLRDEAGRLRERALGFDIDAKECAGDVADAARRCAEHCREAAALLDGYAERAKVSP